MVIHDYFEVAWKNLDDFTKKMMREFTKFAYAEWQKHNYVVAIVFNSDIHSTGTTLQVQFKTLNEVVKDDTNFKCYYTGEITESMWKLILLKNEEA